MNEAIAKINAALDEWESEPRICIVCEKPAGYTGLFIPNNGIAYGAVEGKTRFFIYGVCEKHKGEPVKAYVEKQFLVH